MSSVQRRHIRIHGASVLLAVLLCASSLPAQPTAGWPGRTRYADGALRLSTYVGGSRYFGEFTDAQTGAMAGLQAHYVIAPYFECGIGAEAGRLVYERRQRRNMGGTYAFQFGDANLVDRGTDIMTAELWLRLNLFPAEWFNAWVLAGAGLTSFRPDDYANGDAAFPGPKKINAMTIPVGAGLEYFINSRWSVQLGVVAHVVTSAELDAFDSGRLVELYHRSQGLPGNPEREQTAYDMYMTFSLGIGWYLFADNDIDGDALSNDDERAAGCNPYDPDTDGDGLSDYAEVREYRTDPLLRDTDGDVLSDFVEVTRYHTDPTRADTDGDGIGDREEVMDYQTDPLAKDTENDGLPDAEEKRRGSDPKKVDTDEDGLYDGEEVTEYHTSPTLPDSDGEGISDYDEVKLFGTNPADADSDDDGLTDYEEIRLFHTDPLRVDTDGDGVSDYDELRRDGTDPLSSENATTTDTPGSGS